MRILILVLMIAATGCGGGGSRPAPSSANAPENAGAGGGQAGSGLLVLLPEDLARQEISTTPQMLVEDSHYAVSRKEDSLTWSLTGSLIDRSESSLQAPATVNPSATIRGVPVYVSENEGIKTATWMESGTAFALDVECAAGDDKRCDGNQYILERVRALVERQRP